MQARPFLMFEGKAEEAMTFYVSLFPGGQVLNLERFGPDRPGGLGKAGTVLRGLFRVGGLEVMCFDSPVQHAFTFTPAVSLFVDFDAEADLRRVAATMLEGGEALMPLDNYGFSRLFVWLKDRYGVSWQLNLP
jgi:predicted 3-demethylubiquinone-9 3-methyltransferase (glyoxalase superfamily)